MTAAAEPPGETARPARHRFSRVTDPRVLFPAIGALLLVVIWFATAELIASHYAGARQTAATAAVELARTYEAQVVRALREIDLTLKFIKHAHVAGQEAVILAELAASDLLPPDLLFVVSIADRAGNIVASTRDGNAVAAGGPAEAEQQHATDTLAVSPPHRDPESNQWSVQFSRQLVDAGGGFAGTAIISVDPAYFVSGYEEGAMGHHGVLGILGTDGIFRVKRTGEAVSYGDVVDYPAVVWANDEAAAQAAVSLNPWDEVQRYTAAIEIFGFPLAVVVGLSEQEQLDAVGRTVAEHLWQATGASVLTTLIVAMLGWFSWQLQQSRTRLMEQQVENAQRVEYLAYHDSLTGLPNRSLFSKLLNQSIAQARRYDRHLSVLFLDLDRFKLINDTLGHDAGDELLKEIAARLTAALRESDTVARLGGDEFVVLLPELNEEKQLVAVATKILAAVGLPFSLSAQELRITVSIGISNYPQDGEDEQTLMKNADTAMYNAKDEGKNNFRFYSADLNTNSLERLALESNLRRALERNEFQVYYQARKNLSHDTISGVEALLRWEHPELGTIAAKKFLPLAEETGLIIPIGKWVLRTACQQWVAWREQGLPSLSVSVNLSAREFADDDLVLNISTVMRETGMDPKLLEIEVTENMLMHDLDKTLLILNRLKFLGVRIAIDNFGARYSSLSILKQFDLDTIKIDGTYIRDIIDNTEDDRLIRAIIAMAKVLGLTVVAEGVETREQVDMLDKNACDDIQGFYFSEPIPAAALTALLRAQSAAVTATDPAPA